MPFILVQIRPEGDKRGSWYVKRSDDIGTSRGRYDRAQAIIKAQEMGRSTSRSMLVLIHNEQDRPEEAYAVRGQHWRNLDLIARHPRRGEGTGLL